MLIPYRSSTPLYHYPIATIGLILANVALFLASGMGPGDRSLILDFSCICPYQWVTHAFMHAHWMHLMCNMVFLWTFGMIVEGRVGWLKTLLIYLVIAVIEGAIEQGVMFNISPYGGALGASGVIFGLIAIASLWAPDGELECFVLCGMASRTVEVTVASAGLVYLAFQLIPLAILGYHMSSELLHLVGMLIGLPIGLLMLRLKLVDCDGEDLISQCRTPQRGTDRDKSRKQREPTRPTRRLQTASTLASLSPQEERDRNVLLRSYNAAIDANNSDVASVLLKRLQRYAQTPRDLNKPRTRLAKLLIRQERYREAIAPLRTIAKTGGSLANRAQLQMAWLYVEKLDNATAARRALASLNGPLDEKCEAAAKLLQVRLARRRRRTPVL